VPRPITASRLYNHLQCPHRVFMDAFADPALRDPVSPFVQMLWERGSIFEKQTISGLGVPSTHLSGFRGEEKEAKTRAAVGRGETLNLWRAVIGGRAPGGSRMCCAAGVAGWGAAGVLSLSKIRKLAKEK